MIIVDKNTEVFDWISGLKAEQLSCVRLDLITFEIASGLQTELILVHVDILKELTQVQKEKFESCAGLVIFNPGTEECDFPIKNLIGLINPKAFDQNNINLLINLESRVKSENILKSQLISINHELNEVMGGVEGQLLRVKHTYEKMIPKRLEEFKGVKVFSKYAAGEKSGGEFFDLLTKNNKVFILMSHTSSYLASSTILQSFGNLKQETDFSTKTQEDFLNTILADVHQLAESQEKEISIELFTMIVDLNTLDANLRSIGDFTYYGTDELKGSKRNNDEVIHEQFSFERGERLMICSPGFEQNWLDLREKVELSTLVSNTSIKSLDVLDEAFFQLKKQAGSEFLKSDAASIILEVEQNVMVQM